MSWEDTIKMPKHLKRIKRKIDQMPEYEVVEINARGSHGGKVDFTETEEHEKHEDEPHTFYPPSTPKDKTYGNYMRKLPSIMRRAAQGRKRYMNQSGKPLVAKSWFNGLQKAPLPRRSFASQPIPHFTWDDLTRMPKLSNAKSQAEKSWATLRDKNIKSNLKRFPEDEERIRRILTERYNDKMVNNVYITDVGFGKPNIELLGQHKGYDPNGPKQMKALGDRYRSAENLTYKTFRPVQLREAMQQLIDTPPKGVKLETQLEKIFTEYIKSGAKFDGSHLTLLNKTSFVTGKLKDMLRANMVKSNKRFDN